MVRPGDCFLCLLDYFRRRSALEILLALQQWEIKRCHANEIDFVPGLFGAFRIGVGKGMQIMVTVRIWVALDDSDMF